MSHLHTPCVQLNKFLLCANISLLSSRQILQAFDREVSCSECLAAALVLYARSVQPLHYWTTVIQRFSANHQALLHAR